MLTLPHHLRPFRRSAEAQARRDEELAAWRATNLPRATEAWAKWEAAYATLQPGDAIPAHVEQLREAAYAAEAEEWGQ